MSVTNGVGARIALYSPSGLVNSKHNPFGKDVANIGLFRALAVQGGFDEFSVLTGLRSSDEAVRAELCGDQQTSTRIRAGSILRQSSAAKGGALFRASADLADMAWVRNRTSHRDYSLIGLLHTIAPPAIRDQIAACATVPIQPWDALICTSPSVKDAVSRIFDQLGDYFAERFASSVKPRPLLPVLPLGVEVDRIAALADHPDVRRTVRDELRIGPDDILVLWLGRLSFFEKAFPQPMFRALEEARRASKTRIHFVMLGWFPDGEDGRERYRKAAESYAPNVTVHLLDGNDRARVGAFWAAADVFLSLVDNIQETFGLTLLEAMAAGLPIVASDWDGYRFTVRDGVEGFLIPTLGGPAGAGGLMSLRHLFGLDSYQTYVGTVAQHTAVDVGRAAEAIVSLARDASLRRRMGDAGRARVRNHFDWPVVAAQYRVLVDELTDIRSKSAPFGTDLGTRQSRSSPSKGEPFADFAGFATSVLNNDTWLFRRSVSGDPVSEAEPGKTITSLDAFGAAWRLSAEECRSLLDALAAGPRRVATILADFEPAQRNAAALTLVWLCKRGVVGWSTFEPSA